MKASGIHFPVLNTLDGWKMEGREEGRSNNQNTYFTSPERHTSGDGADDDDDDDGETS